MESLIFLAPIFEFMGTLASLSMPFIALIFGFVEGITEFLPVSSTGHLILTNHLLGFGSEGTVEGFEVVIQIGAMFAVLWLYFERFWGLLFPAKENPPKFSGFYGLYLLFLTSLPASLLGLILHKYIKMLFSVQSVLFFLVVGAFFMLIAEHFQEKKSKNTKQIESIDELTPRLALGIGLFQILALCPGFSRSASTIMGGMFLNLSRKTAAEYSFFAAVPIIVAASAYDFLKSFEALTTVDIAFLGYGILFSFIFAVLAIKLFISFVSKYSFRVFAYYRILVAIVLYLYFF